MGTGCRKVERVPKWRGFQVLGEATSEARNGAAARLNTVASYIPVRYVKRWAG